MSAAFQLVRKAERERIVGRDHRVIDVLMAIQPLAYRFDIAIINVYKLGKLADPCVAFHGVNFIHLWRFCNRLHDCVFSTAVSDHEYVHFLSPNFMLQRIPVCRIF